MISPRWFLVASVLLALNVIAVITTGFWRHLSADEPATAAEVVAEKSEPSAVPRSSPSLQSSAAEAAESTHGASAVDLPLPEGLPAVPSLQDADKLKDDPGFQEFRRLFAQEEESWQSELPRSQLPEVAQGQAYFSALDERLGTVEQICIVARRVAAEAARHAQNGHGHQSDSLLEMATQLRDMAAKLLVAEL